MLNGNFQLYTLQWVGGATTDPDILRRVFHSNQVPPAGFNRGHFIDAARRRTARRGGADDRRSGASAVCLARRSARSPSRSPYICLWTKINNVIGQRTLEGMRVTPIADYWFLKDVARRSP